MSDATEDSAGWYWQFNRKQGYKHDGVTRTPNTAWITSIDENLDWEAANDPCTLELGTGWRLPTRAEYTYMDSVGNWTTWTSDNGGPWGTSLKIHGAGNLASPGGGLSVRGAYAHIWSSTQGSNTVGWGFHCTSYMCFVGNDSNKNLGQSVRCVKDL